MLLKHDSLVRIAPCLDSLNLEGTSVMRESLNPPILGDLLHRATIVNQPIATELNILWKQGMNTANLVYLLRSILAERESQQTQRDAIDLVWTGDEILGASGRDTRVVVQELFRTAQRSVLISTYAIDRGWGDVER
jgi:hypothetical protein